MKRTYQYGFSDMNPAMYMAEGRQRKAMTMVAVLEDYFGNNLKKRSLLDVGSSTGIIDNVLADHVGHVTGIDIDTRAVHYAGNTFQKENLVFEQGDAMHLGYPSKTFDIVICAQVYEHVPDAHLMMAEIHRVLKPGGVCYFAAGNRLMVMEPHYRLPFLSILPLGLANRYLKLTKKGAYYHESHFFYWGLKKLVKHFLIHDYTAKMIATPKRFHTAYMVPEGSLKQKLARYIADYLIWLAPGYIWILEKPSTPIP